MFSTSDMNATTVTVGEIECVLAVDGDPAFLIPYTKDTTIAELKEAIHQHCIDDLSQIRADKLKLYLIESTSDDEEITGTSTVPKNHISMGKPKSKLSHYIGTRNPNTVYVFVEPTRPQPVAHAGATEESKILRKTIEDLQNTIADFQKTIETLNDTIEAEREKAAKAAEEVRKKDAELQSFKQDHIFQLIVGLKRTTTISWTANITTATLDNLRERISNAYPEEYRYNGLRFVFKLKNEDCISLNSDEDLRTTLRTLVESDEKTIKVQVQTLQKPFSDYTLEMVAKTYGLDVQPDQTVELDIFDGFTCGTTSMRDQDIFSHLVKDLELTFSTTPLDKAPEAVHSLYVHSFLKVVVADIVRSKISWQNLIIRPEKYITGELGKGPVDYAITLTDGTIIGVTEVKRDDFRKGVAQNAVQIDSILSRKRKAEDIDEVPLRSFGIVANAEKWMFLECTRDKGQSKFRLSRTYMVGYGKAGTEKDVQAVVEVIKWLFLTSSKTTQALVASNKQTKKIKMVHSGTGSNSEEE